MAGRAGAHSAGQNGEGAPGCSTARQISESGGGTMAPHVGQVSQGVSGCRFLPTSVPVRRLSSTPQPRLHVR